MPANEVFDALKDAGVNSSDISCVQPQSSGEIVLTFRCAQFKENFLQKNVIKLRDQPFAVQDVERPLTHLQVFDTPHEMPDPTIINRLSKYCDVLSSRRGYFRENGWENVQDGVRHYRVRIKSPIPNYMRFGKILIHKVRSCPFSWTRETVIVSAESPEDNNINDINIQHLRKTLRPPLENLFSPALTRPLMSMTMISSLFPMKPTAKPN